MTSGQKYWAFLSFCPEDEKLADILHSALENYQINKDIVGLETSVGRVPDKLKPIFIDKDVLNESSTFTNDLIKILEEVPYLIVICSSNTPKNDYVNEVVKIFKSWGKKSAIIPIVVESSHIDKAHEYFPKDLEQDDEQFIELQKPLFFKHGKDWFIRLSEIGTRIFELEENNFYLREDNKKIVIKFAQLLKVAAVFFGVSLALGMFWIFLQLRTNDQAAISVLEYIEETLTSQKHQFATVTSHAKEQVESLKRLEHLVDSIDNSSLWRGRHRLVLARLNYRIAELHELLGNSKSHRSRLENAALQFRKLLNAHPNDDSIQNELADVLIDLGDILSVEGKLTISQVKYLEALELRKKIAVLNLQRPGLQLDLAKSYVKIGDGLVRQGKTKEGRDYYKESLIILESISETVDSENDRQADIAFSQSRVGDTFLAQGDLSKALSQYELALQLRKKILKVEPLNNEIKRDVAINHDKIGNVHLQKGNLKEAKRQYLNSMSIRRQVVSENPEHRDWQQDLVVSYNKIGDIYLLQDEPAKALSHFKTSVSILQQMQELEPENALWLAKLSLAHDKLGEVLTSLQILSSALQNYQAALDLRTELVSIDQESIKWQYELSISHIQIGRLHLDQGNSDDAQGSFEKSLEIRRRLVSLKPSNEQMRRGLALNHDHLAELSLKLGDFKTAELNYQKSFDIYHRLAIDLPEDQIRQADLALIHERIGDLEIARSNFVSAKDSYSRSLNIRKKSLEINPGSLRSKRDSAISYGKLGRVLMRLDNIQEAIGLFEEGKRLVQPLATQAEDGLWASILRGFDEEIKLARTKLSAN